jgi:hypothetical protein
MSSTYSPDLRIELIANGEQSGVWGTTTNNNLGTLIEDAIAKTALPTLTSTTPWFTAANGVSDTARCAAVDVAVDGSITTAFTAYIPPVPKLYVVKNSTAYTMTLRNATGLNSSTSAGGTTVVIPTGKTVIVRSDGTNCVSQFDYIPNNLQMSGNLTVDGSTTLSGGVVIGGARLSATYVQGSGSTTATFTVANTYVGGVTQVYIGTLSGTFVSGIYTVATATSTNFTVTATAPSGAISGSAYVTDDVITINAIVVAGVVIEGSSTIPALRVTQTGAGAALLIEDSANIDSSPFTVDASGNVGVGTATPAQLLDITSDSTAISQLSRYSTDTSGAASLVRKSRGTLAAPTIVVSGDTTGTVAFQAYDGAAFQSVAQITSAVDGTPGANDTPGRLVISTTPDGSATLVERVRVDNAGNVIIGSGEASATTVGNTLRAPNRTGTDVAGANLVITAGNGTGTGGSGSITLQTANVGTTSSTANTMVDRLRIQTNGLMFGSYAAQGAGVIPSQLYYRLVAGYVGSNVSTVQSLFGRGVPLAASTTYAFEMMVVLQKSAGATSHNVSLLFDIGSGTFVDMTYYLNGTFKNNPLTSINSPDVCLYAEVATATVVTDNTTSTGVNFIGLVKGTFSVGTAGTWTPQYKLSAAPGGAYTTLAGSYVTVYPIGPSGSAINNGGWV